MNLKEQIEKIASELSFYAVGVTSTEYDPVAHDKHLRWLDKGYQAEMAYLEKNSRKRFDPKAHLPNARSVIVCAHNYYNEPNNNPNDGYISIYARGEDYHNVIREKLQRLCDNITDIHGDFNYKICVDTSAISEKTLAVKAGIGFIGRNGIVIIPKKKRETVPPKGSFHFLGVIITDIDLQPDEIGVGTCGKCTKCIDACPTNAIIGDGVIDADQCISYHTTHNKNEIPDDLKPRFDNMMFGCDICQLVCPYNNSPVITSETKFHPISELADNRLSTLSNEDLRKSISITALSAMGVEAVKRNIKIALDNIITKTEN